MHADSSPITELVTDARFLFDGNEANVARVGGLTLIFAALSGKRPCASKLPREKITVG